MGSVISSHASDENLQNPLFLLQGDNKGFLVCKKKMATSADLLCRYSPPAFRSFTEAVVNLKFDEEPKYNAYVTLFEPLCGPVLERPILLEDKTRVGQKRAREAVEEDVEIVRRPPPHVILPVFFIVKHAGVVGLVFCIGFTGRGRRVCMLGAVCGAGPVSKVVPCQPLPHPSYQRSYPAQLMLL